MAGCIEGDGVVFVDIIVQRGAHVVEAVTVLAVVGLFHAGGVFVIPGVSPHRASVAEAETADAVADEQVDLVVAVVEAETAVIAVKVEMVFVVIVQHGGGGTDRGHAVESRLFLLLEDHIENACHAIRFQTCGGVRDHLDALDEVGGDLVQCQVGGTANHEDRHVLAAAQAHVALDIHGDGGDLLQDFHSRLAGTGDAGLHVIDRLVEIALDHVALRPDDHCLEFLRLVGHLEFVDLIDRMFLCDLKRS